MKISVITICFNSAAQIGKTIDSVLAQEYDDLEYVIVDGGSTDGTVDIIRTRAAGDARVRWVSEPDDGISDAMNKGVSLATGEIIAHLHSDEYYTEPTVLAQVAARFEADPGRVWLTAGFYFVDERGRFLREIEVRRYSYRRLIRSNIILHPATFVKRSAFLDVGGFDLSLRYCMDYHLWLRLGALDDPIVLKCALACFCVHGGSRSTMEAANAYAEEFQVRQEFLRQRGSWLFPYRLEYLVKKELNRIFIRNLIDSARQGEP